MNTQIHTPYYFNISSTLAVHRVVILLVVARGDIVEPLLIVEIPADGLLDAFLKLKTWLPAKFALKFSGVDGITSIMTEAVGDVGDEVEIFAFLASKESVNGIDDRLDYVGVLPLVEAADVVGFSNLAIVEDGVDGACVIYYIQPVTYVLTLAIDRQWLAMTDVVDEKWNQLLGELIRTIVVRAVGHDGRHAVGIVESTDEMVGTGL